MYTSVYTSIYISHPHFLCVFQINLRGLDGIQGPVYVGTGCVFNRTALYGYEPPLKPKHKKPGVLASLCGGSRKKGSKSSKKGSDNKKSSKHVDPTVPIFNLEDIEEGVEGTTISISASQLCLDIDELGDKKLEKKKIHRYVITILPLNYTSFTRFLRSLSNTRKTLSPFLVFLS